MFGQFFISPQVKRIAIITNNYGKYELLNDLKLEHRKYQENLKPS